MKRQLCAALALLLNACDEPESSVAVRNECLGEDTCERDSLVHCDRDLLACVRERTSEGYELIARVSLATESTVLEDGGIPLVSQHVINLGAFTDERDAEVLRVPDAVTLNGFVRSPQGAALASQLTIAPHAALVPVRPSVVETRSESMPSDAGARQLTLLNPDFRYDVRVQPLLVSSGELPPLEQTDVSPGDPLGITYGAVESRPGKLVSRSGAIEPHRVRLEDKTSGRVVSSTARVSTTPGEEGTFRLYAEQGVFQRGNFNLVVSFARFDPWQVTAVIDGARLLAGGDLFLPQVPALVSSVGSVEDRPTDPAPERGQGNKLPNALLTFVARDPEPVVVSDAGGPPPSAGGADWCRLEGSAPIACRASFTTFSDEAGSYKLDLLPGEYDIFILPNANEPASRRIGATQNAARLVVTSDAKGNNVLAAKPAAAIRGTVNSARIAVPNVTVRALARPTLPFSSWGEVTRFNRSSSVVTDRKGQFELFADVGYYDFVAEVAEGSGFPWKLWLDCPNGPDAGDRQLRRVDLTAPVMVAGVVQSQRGSVALANARIEAFAVVAKEGGEPRAVLIGRTESDETGAYRLFLPPRVGEPKSGCESSGVVTDSARIIR